MIDPLQDVYAKEEERYRKQRSNEIIAIFVCLVAFLLLFGLALFVTRIYWVLLGGA